MPKAISVNRMEIGVPPQTSVHPSQQFALRHLDTVERAESNYWAVILWEPLCVGFIFIYSVAFHVLLPKCVRVCLRNGMWNVRGLVDRVVVPWCRTYFGEEVNQLFTFMT